MTRKNGVAPKRGGNNIGGVGVVSEEEPGSLRAYSPESCFELHLIGPVIADSTKGEGGHIRFFRDQLVRGSEELSGVVHEVKAKPLKFLAGYVGPLPMIVVSEHGKGRQTRGEPFKNADAIHHIFIGIADVIAGEEDDIGVEGIRLFHRVPDLLERDVRAKVGIGDLNDAKALEGRVEVFEGESESPNLQPVGLEKTSVANTGDGDGGGDHRSDAEKLSARGQEAGRGRGDGEAFDFRSESFGGGCRER